MSLVVVSLYNQWTGNSPDDPDGTLEPQVGQVWTGFESKADAEKFIEECQFPTPEMVFVVSTREVTR